MATLEIKDQGNKVVDKVDVRSDVFERPLKKSVLHEAVVHYQAGLRQGTHSTLTRAEVWGSSRKPWRQKGTGRARHGDRRSPIWRHGGITFGPKPRDYSTRFPRTKMRRALQMALSAKFADGRIVVLDAIQVEEPKTRLMAGLLEGLGLEGRTLIFVPEADEKLELASRNLSDVKLVTGHGLNVYDLVYYDNLLTTRDGIARIDEGLA